MLRSIVVVVGRRHVLHGRMCLAESSSSSLWRPLLAGVVDTTIPQYSHPKATTVQVRNFSKESQKKRRRKNKQRARLHLSEDEQSLFRLDSLSLHNSTSAYNASFSADKTTQVAVPSRTVQTTVTTRPYWTREIMQERQYFLQSHGICKDTLTHYLQHIHASFAIPPATVESFSHHQRDSSGKTLNVTVRTTHIPKSMVSSLQHAATAAMANNNVQQEEEESVVVKEEEEEVGGSSSRYPTFLAHPCDQPADLSKPQFTIDLSQLKVTDDDRSYILVNAGLAETKKESNRLAIMDWMWQLYHELGVGDQLLGETGRNSLYTMADGEPFLTGAGTNGQTQQQLRAAQTKAERRQRHEMHNAMKQREKIERKIQQENLLKEREQLARYARRLLDWVSNDKFRRLSVETRMVHEGKKGVPQELVADLTVRLRNGRKLIGTGTGAKSKDQAIQNVLVEASGEPLCRALGDNLYQHYRRLVDHTFRLSTTTTTVHNTTAVDDNGPSSLFLSESGDTPATTAANITITNNNNNIARLCVPALPEPAMQLLETAMGPDRQHRWEMLHEQVQHSEAIGRAKRLAQYQRQLQREREKLAARTMARQKNDIYDDNGHQSADWQRMQANLVAQERTRMERAIGTEMEKIRQNLPITAIRNELLTALHGPDDCSVVVVSGGTGSGKSTQCPQYILEDAILSRRNGPDTHIIVTQPRRIAAMSVAERVAAERNEHMGHGQCAVGYNVRHNRVAPARQHATIEFVTTGVLLRRLQNDRTLSGVSHVMIDEVHERDINTDFLLILLKELIVHRPDLKVVIMSATLDAEGIARYFEQDYRDNQQHPTTAEETGNHRRRRVPCLSVPAKPRYPVEVVYIEDIVTAAAATQNASDDNDGNESVDKWFSDQGEKKTYPVSLRDRAESLLNMQDMQLRYDLDSYKQDEEYRSFDEELNGPSAASTESALVQSARALARLRGAKLAEAAEMRGISRDNNNDGRRTGGTNNPNALSNALFDTMAHLALHVAKTEMDQGRKGSILCFLPGWDEIKLTMKILEDIAQEWMPKLNLIALHSTIPKEDQHRIFDPARDGTMKIILATNIAESSVTINDALAIIDAGLVREMNWNAESEMSTMNTLATSKASATQRLGRAGRVAPGRCYRLYSRGFFHTMPERPSPEIQRAGLENTCLQACGMTTDGVQLFLSRAMDPPASETVQYSLENLKHLGAIKEMPNGRGEVLTNVGRLLSQLPLDPTIGKMLMLGCVLQCLDPVLTAAACMSGSDPFYRPLDARDEARARRISFCDKSDIMSIVKAYKIYMEKQKGYEDWDSTRQWALENYISPAAISRISTLRSQLVQELQKIHFVDNSDFDSLYSKIKSVSERSVLNRHSNNESLVVGVWATGVPRNLAARNYMGNFGSMVTRTESKTGLHPSSVAFHRKPPQSPAELPSWFFYSEMVHSSEVYLRNVTAVTPEQLLLFGGFNLKNCHLGHADEEPESSASSVGGACTILDDWIIADAACEKTVNLLVDARREIDAALTKRVMNPQSNNDAKTQQVIDAIAKTLRIVKGENVDDDDDDDNNNGTEQEVVAYW